MVEGVAELGWFEMMSRLGLGALLGALLGMQREWDGQDAGFRTHLLVVLGATLFGVISVGGFDAFVAPRSDTNVTVDVTRIAAYVAPGIGFIGGGAILKYGGKVTGITTAASLWTAAAIGVAAGLGAWESAVAATVIALIALEVLQPMSNMLNRASRRHKAGVLIRVDRPADIGAITAAVNDFSNDVKQLTFGWGPDDEGFISVDYWTTPSDAEALHLAERLRQIEGVRSVAINRASGW
ncbi:MAG: MgtC/SapB family protein [Acidimicrobiales bacterium]